MDLTPLWVRVQAHFFKKAYTPVLHPGGNFYTPIQRHVLFPARHYERCAQCKGGWVANAPQPFCSATLRKSKPLTSGPSHLFRLRLAGKAHSNEQAHKKGRPIRTLLNQIHDHFPAVAVPAAAIVQLRLQASCV